MRKTQKVIIITLVMVMFLSSTTSSWANSSKSNIQFKDTKPTDWYMSTVSKLVELKGIQGFPDGTFKPNLQIKKGEFIKILMISLGFDEGIATPEQTDHWASNYLKKAKSLGIVDYYDMAYNQLDEVITRNEMAKMVVRAVEYKGEKHIEDREKYIYQIKDYNNILDKEIRIKDIDTTKIKGYGNYTLNKENGLYSVYNNYKDYVLKAYTKGLITGYTDGEFKGYNGLSRAEASTVIIRVLDNTERKLPSEAKESAKTKELTDADIKRLQSYKADLRGNGIGFEEYYRNHRESAEGWISKFNPIDFGVQGGASQIEWITDPKLVYRDVLSDRGIRGILRVRYDKKNDEGLTPGIYYERDVEFFVANTGNPDGSISMKLHETKYLSPWKEVK